MRNKNVFISTFISSIYEYFIGLYFLIISGSVDPENEQTISDGKNFCKLSAYIYIYETTIYIIYI